jgi:PAS domain S-box-containing protein
VLLATVAALVRLRRAERGLREAARHWETTFDAIAEGICLVDLSGTIQQCNHAFARLFDRAPQELTGTRCAELWQAVAPPGAFSPLGRLRRSGQREVRELGRGGQQFRVLGDPVREGDELIGAVFIVSDVTAEREAEAARAALMAHEQAMRREAEEANRAKDEFLAMLGHELRNPLGAIASAVQILDMIGEREPPAIRARDVIRRQMQHLGRLVDDLLDVARVTTGKISLAREPVDLAEIVKRCVVEVAGRSGRHDVALDLAPTWVMADPARIDQIATNLVSNALKFTPPGAGIRVSVRGDGSTAALVVADAGVGMPADIRDRVFNLFFQAQDSPDRAQGGLGIGLTLVRRLVELHGGTVVAESEGPGRGSTFRVHLPQVPAPRGEDARTDRAAAPGGRRILIVEDNPDAREMLGVTLRMAGHEVHEAADGSEAVKIALAARPDLALIDLGLPGLDGYEVARQVRAGADWPIILVALSGYGLPEHRRRGEEAGFDEFLVKPLDPAQLDRVVGRLGDGPGRTSG